MKILYAVIIAIFSSNLVFAQSFDEKFTTASNVGLTVSNLGIIGNAFNGSFDLEGFPSCRYPKDSDIEHLFDGGLWVGAKINGVTDAVTTGALDASSGYSTGRAGFEFSAPVGATLLEKSSLFDSPVFDPAAISHQDFVADETPVIPRKRLSGVLRRAVIDGPPGSIPDILVVRPPFRILSHGLHGKRTSEADIFRRMISIERKLKTIRAPILHRQDTHLFQHVLEVGRPKTLPTRKRFTVAARQFQPSLADQAQIVA